MSVTITFTNADGNQQTFQRTVDKNSGDCAAASELAALRANLGQLQTELNAALTVQAEKEKAAKVTTGQTVNNQKDEGSQDEDEEDDDDDNTEQNGKEPPAKIQKIS